jgi:starch phosphorylase
MFGLKTDEVHDLQAKGYKPNEFIEANAELKSVIELIESGFFSPEKIDLFKPITDHLRYKDTYLLAADFADYLRAQNDASTSYKNVPEWTKRSILNTARMGKFSSDRTIAEYAKEIWGVEPIGRKAG